MMISEFARATGLTPDTVRFYIRRGLITPETGGKGGSNPYQIFTAAHVHTAQIIRMCQSLGFTLREIAALNDEAQSGISPARAKEIMEAQLVRLEDKAAQIGAMISYTRDKLAWLDTDRKRPEPNFTDYAAKVRDPERRQIAA